MSDVSSKSKPATKWNPVLGPLLVIGLYFIAPLIGAQFLVLFGDGLLQQEVLTQFLYIVIIEAITVAALVYFLRRNNASLKDIGLGKLRPKHLAIGLAVYPIYFLTYAAVFIGVAQFIPGINVDQEQQLGFDNVQGIVALSLTFVSLVILPPIIEEITVRGMLFTSLRSRLTLLPATLVTSGIFAVAHLPAGGAEGPLYIAAIDTFILSLLLCYVREKTGSLWPGITLHALKNGIAYFTLFIVPLISTI